MLHIYFVQAERRLLHDDDDDAFSQLIDAIYQTLAIFRTKLVCLPTQVDNTLVNVNCDIHEASRIRRSAKAHAGRGSCPGRLLCVLR